MALPQPTFSIAADERRVNIQLETLTNEVKARARGRIAAISQTLLQQVRAAEPSRTGRLRMATHAWVSDGPDYVRGGVSIAPLGSDAHNVAAAALEWGVKGTTIKVKAHEARLTQMFGHAVTPFTVMIKAHQRKDVNITARRFLRGPFSAMKARAIAELTEAVAETKVRS